MNSFTLHDLQPLLDAHAYPLLLFQDECLCGLNQAASRLFPSLSPGLSAQSLLGEDAYSAFSYAGSGSRIFSGEILGLRRELRVTRWMGYQLLELSLPAASDQNVLASAAQGILAPLTGVMAAAPELLRHTADSEDAKLQAVSAQLSQGIYSVYRAANHLRLCSTPGQLTVNPRCENISHWLTLQYQLLSPLADEARRTITLKLPPVDFTCQFDPERLGQALMNLISNAIKFTDPGGEISIQLKKTASTRLCIIVRDNGCGIPADQMGAIFNRCSAPREMPDPRWGVGLGLPLARSIMQLHGGSLILESQAGQGTTVYLALPYSGRAAEQPLHTSVQRPAALGGFSPALVELADALPSSVYDFRDLDG